jgi:hypothetical protein
MSALLTIIAQAIIKKKSLRLISGFSALVLMAPAALAAPADARGSQTGKDIQASLMADGIYVYGQSEKRDQVGHTYFVFEVKRGSLTGALYSPNSSFDCTYGRVQSGELALNVIDSYEKKSYPFEIALDRSSTVASRSGVAAPVSLQGFKKVEGFSAGDRAMLKSCKATASVK